MNILFASVFLLSTVLLLFLAPNDFLSALLSASSKSATLCISLIATYSVWLGLMRVWEDSGVSRRVSKLLKPVAKRLFAVDDDKTLDAVCMNLSVNLLGISGAGTPYGVKSASLLNESPNAEYASCMFFVVNATSLQLIPTSMIGLRTALGSVQPSAVVLPTLLTSLFSTLLGILLVKICIPKREKTRDGAKGKRFAFRKAGAK